LAALGVLLAGLLSIAAAVAMGGLDAIVRLQITAGSQGAYVYNQLEGTVMYCPLQLAGHGCLQIYPPQPFSNASATPNVNEAPTQFKRDPAFEQMLGPPPVDPQR
jgi:hypothetical protein